MKPQKVFFNFFSSFFSFMESRNNKSDRSISGHFKMWKSEVH